MQITFIISFLLLFSAFHLADGRSILYLIAIFILMEYNGRQFVILVITDLVRTVRIGHLEDAVSLVHYETALIHRTVRRGVLSLAMTGPQVVNALEITLIYTVTQILHSVLRTVFHGHGTDGILWNIIINRSLQIAAVIPFYMIGLLSSAVNAANLNFLILYSIIVVFKHR